MTPDEIRKQRRHLRMSRLELARRAGVSRYRMYAYEVGDGPALTAEEIARIREALKREGADIRRQLAEAGV
jgi:predicted transcriptional regulator